jgi:hypothetical protein
MWQLATVQPPNLDSANSLVTREMYVSLLLKEYTFAWKNKQRLVPKARIGPFDESIFVYELREALDAGILSVLLAHSTLKARCY